MALPIPPSRLATWTDLEAELDQWAASGKPATLWWRDDDAVAPTPALDRLLTIAGGTPLALAVIPAEAEAGLAKRLAGIDGIAVLQHGWRHTNHAPPADKKDELGLHRPLHIRREELAHGGARLAALFGAQALPVLTPPWNRIAADLVSELPGIGIRGLSMVKPRPAAEPVPGLRAANVQVDLIEWRDDRRFIGEAAALGGIVGHLAARRLGLADADEPTGLLTHHLVQDGASEAFLGDFLAAARDHHAAKFLAAADVFRAS